MLGQTALGGCRSGLKYSASPMKSLPGRQVLYFKNIFLLWLKLSILISKALLKEMASGEESDLAHFTGLGWAQRLAPALRGREQRKHSRGGEENKK